MIEKKEGHVKYTLVYIGSFWIVDTTIFSFLKLLIWSDKFLTNSVSGNNMSFIPIIFSYWHSRFPSKISWFFCLSCMKSSWEVISFNIASWVSHLVILVDLANSLWYFFWESSVTWLKYDKGRQYDSFLLLFLGMKKLIDFIP